jgi:LysM repeat protein
MSTPNPMNPQGSLLEQKAKRKNNLPVIVAIFLGIHAVVLGGILMAGCKPEPKVEAKKPAPEPNLPPITPPPDAGSPVAPAPGGATAPGMLPPIGGAPGTTPGLAPLPTTPPAPVVAPVAPVAPITPAPVAPVAPVVPAPIPEPVTPPAAAPVAPVGEAKVHVIAKGEFFAVIAKKYGVSVKAIEGANPGVDSTKLKIGQKLNIPAPAPKAAKAYAPAGEAGVESAGTHTVKSGDTLGGIAKKHGTTVAKLREANGLKTDQIKVGQKLKLPVGSAKKSAEPAAAAPKAVEPAPVAPVVPALPPGFPSVDPAPAPAPKF